MTALCPGGGPSGPKQLSPATVFLSGATLTALLADWLELSDPWIALLAYAGSQTVDITSICITDPPPIVWPTAEDIAGFFADLAGANTNIYNFFVAATLNAAWYAFCQCTAVSTPSAPAAPAYPIGAPVGNPPGFTGGTGAPCLSQVASATIPVATSGAPSFNTDLTPQLGTPLVAVTPPQPGGASNAALVPANVTGITGTITASGIGPGPRGQVFLFDATGNQLAPIFAAFDFSGAPPTQSTQTHSTGLVTVPVAPNSLMFEVYSYWPGTGAQQGSPWSLSWQLSLYCAGPPGNPAQCCPPDPTVLAELEQILALLTNLTTQAPLPGYADSTVHGGLTGGGTILLGRQTVAYRVDVTSDLTSWPHHPQTPTYYLSLGFMTPYAEGVPMRGSRLIYQTQTYPVSMQTTEVGYQLEPNVIANITELIPAAS